MSVDVDKYFGWTIELKKDLESKDFDFYHKIIEKNPNLNQYGKGAFPNEIKLVIDGMNGLFARLIYILSVQYDISWVDEDNHILNETLKNNVAPENVFNELNEIYIKITGKELQHDQVNLKEWHNWG